MRSSVRSKSFGTFLRPRNRPRFQQQFFFFLHISPRVYFTAENGDRCNVEQKGKRDTNSVASSFGGQRDKNKKKVKDLTCFSRHTAAQFLDLGLRHLSSFRLLCKRLWVLLERKEHSQAVGVGRLVGCPMQRGRGWDPSRFRHRANTFHAVRRDCWSWVILLGSQASRFWDEFCGHRRSPSTRPRFIRKW